MKIISLLFFTLIIGTGCASQKNKIMKEVTIEYSAVSRGLYQKIIVKNQSSVIANSRDKKPVTQPISEQDWKAIATAFDKINLSEIASLKAPTQKRFYDGAAIANLKITQQGIIYETTDFDHGFPPVVLEKLVALIVALDKN